MTSPTPQADFDSPWKEIIERYFPDFMAFFFPQAYTEIDWKRPYTFLDKELQQVVREAETGQRRVDKLVKVFLQDGQETWLLIHIEVQGQRETNFAERMYIYHYRIFDRYHRQVVSLAILTDDQRHWRPDRYRYERWGCRLSLDFPTVKLLDYEERQDELTTSDNPFATAVLAHLQTMATRQEPLERYAAKLRLAKMLYQRGYGRQDILELLRFIDWVMTLPGNLAQQFRHELTQFEEEMKMQYVTSMERLAIEEGKQTGKQEGKQEGIQEGILQSIVDALTVRFGEVSDEIVTPLDQVENVDMLRSIFRQAMTVDSLDAFVQLLSETTE